MNVTNESIPHKTDSENDVKVRVKFNKIQHSYLKFLSTSVVAARTSTTASDHQANSLSDLDTNQSTIKTMIKQKTSNDSLIEDFLDQYDPLGRQLIS